MKLFLRRFLLFTVVLWLFIGACPLLILYLSPDSSLTAAVTPATPTPAPDTPVHTADTDSYRILDESTNTILTVSEADFLPCALLCEMPPDAPDEALKAQAIAIHTACSRMRLQNTGAEYDFSCSSSSSTIYAPPQILAEQYGSEWDTVFSRIQSLCAEVADLNLYFDDELITAQYFAISAGCTQPYEAVFDGEPLPYLQAVSCPSDLLNGNCRAVVSITPEKIRAAFPSVLFSEDPQSWFSESQQNSAGYVTTVSLCGTDFTGTQVRSALSLRSAAFTVTFDGESFIFTTLGLGHGVGMSQAGAVYMAENGADHTDILSYFYPGTSLK